MFFSTSEEQKKNHDCIIFIFIIGELTNPRTTNSHGIELFYYYLLFLLLARVLFSFSKLPAVHVYLFVQYPITGFRERNGAKETTRKGKR